jgi:hypothetical protein
MLETTLKAVLGISLIVCGWLSVQMAWQRVFAKSYAGDEPTFDRCGCQSCCRSVCDRATVNEENRAKQAQPGGQPNYQED